MSELATDYQLFEVAAEFYQPQVAELEAKGKEATYKNWHDLSLKLCFSLALTKAFYFYQGRPKKRICSEYKRFVLERAEQHSLVELCRLVTAQGGRLRKDSFFIALLENQGSIGFDAVLEPFLCETDLRDCIYNRRYLPRGDESITELFSSPTKAARDRIQKAVAVFADKHTKTAANEGEVEVEMCVIRSVGVTSRI